MSLKAQLQESASRNVYLGTSSWKYAGWCGTIYDEQRYITRGKFSEKRFEQECISEYAETFPTVCVDAGYYRFPSETYLAKLCNAVPDGFRFSFKVTDEITAKPFPNLPRHGERAGKPNENFLNTSLFRSAFLHACEPFRNKIGALIFEFSQFYAKDFAQGRDFVAALDRFLGELPDGWQYAVEIRNKKLLRDEYFEVLNRHGVAHVFNSWTRMPTVSTQLAIPGSVTTDFVVGRFLLTSGRTYEQAVKEFSPYREIKKPDPDVRKVGRIFILKAVEVSKRPSFVYVNNRLEGHAPGTIQMMLGL